MDTTEHIDALERDGTTLAGAAADAGLDAPVPSCPGWRVADLLRHTGYVHRWAARHVTEQPTEVIDGSPEEEILGKPEAHEVIDWFRQGHAALVGIFRRADPEARYGVFLPSATSPLAFWARRQAHETAIHRADAQLAAGQAPAYDAGFAADGIDELIMGFAARSRRPPKNALGKTMLVRATDTKDAWHIAWPTETGHKAICQQAEHDADCVLTGPAAGLYLLLWNRRDNRTADVTIDGDTAVADAWRQEFHVRW